MNRPEDTPKIYKEIRRKRLAPFKAEIDEYFKKKIYASGLVVKQEE